MERNYEGTTSACLGTACVEAGLRLAGTG